MGLKKQGKLSWSKQKKQWQRTLGRYRTTSGKIDGKRFLLGTDQAAATFAVERLCRLWEEVEEEARRESARRVKAADTDFILFGDVEECPAWIRSDGDLGLVATRLATGEPLQSFYEGLAASRAAADCAVEPLWSKQTLAIATQIVAGSQRLLIPRLDDWKDVWPDMIDSPLLIGRATTDATRVGIPDEPAYREQVKRYRLRFPDLVCGSVNEDGDLDEGPASKPLHDGPLSSCDKPAALRRSNYSLHEALDDYAEQSFAKHHNPEARTKNRDYGNRKRDGVLSLKEAHEDIAVEAVKLGVIREMCEHYTRRPLAKRSGKPIAVATVRHKFRFISSFFGWLETKEESFRIPAGAAREWRFDSRRLMTREERAAAVTKKMAFEVEELRQLALEADEVDRLLILGGLNCGFAQSEWCSLSWQEVQQEGDDTYIRRLRGKSSVYG